MVLSLNFALTQGVKISLATRVANFTFRGAKNFANNKTENFVDSLKLLCYSSKAPYRGCNFLWRIFGMRVKITLACQECKQRNYDTTKNKKTTPDRLEIKKYCKFCKKTTVHKETK